MVETTASAEARRCAADVTESTLDRCFVLLPGQMLRLAPSSAHGGRPRSQRRSAEVPEQDGQRSQYRARAHSSSPAPSPERAWHASL
eukprot:8384347-Pyramimonas_sp.AAC.1